MSTDNDSFMLYYPHVQKICNVIAYKYKYNKEDLLQESYIIFLELRVSYNPHNNTTFIWYINKWLTKKLIEYIKRNTIYKDREILKGSMDDM